MIVFLTTLLSNKNLIRTGRNIAFYDMHFLGNFFIFCNKFFSSEWKFDGSCYYLVQLPLMAQILFQLVRLPLRAHPFILSFEAMLKFLPLGSFLLIEIIANCIGDSKLIKVVCSKYHTCEK